MTFEMSGSRQTTHRKKGSPVPTLILLVLAVFAMLAALLAVMYGGASVLWAVMLGGLWLTQTLTYLLRAHALDSGRAKTE